MGTCICGHTLTAHAAEPEPICRIRTCGCSYPQQAGLEWTHTCHYITRTLNTGQTCHLCGRTQ